MALSKLEKVDKDQTLLDGLRANFPLTATFLLVNVRWKVTDLTKLLSARRAARARTANAKNTYATAVADEEKIENEVAPLRKGLQRTLQGQYGDDGTKLAEFGFSPSKRKKPSAETTAQAVKQSKATREARGTMTKKAKAAIKGVVPSDGGVSASGASVKAATTTSTPAATTTNGAPPATNGTASS
jgi:hypothetical protein